MSLRAGSPDDSEPRLRYADTMMLDIQRSPRSEVELIDSAAIVGDLTALAKRHAGRERELRTAVALRLKSALTQARSRAEQLLLKDRHGRRCAHHGGQHGEGCTCGDGTCSTDTMGLDGSRASAHRKGRHAGHC